MEGTRLISAIQTADDWRFGECDVFDLIATSERVFFAANDGPNGCELWSSDGTTAGTRLFQNIAPGALPSLPHDMRLVSDQLLLIADDGSHGSELWAIPIHLQFIHLPIVQK